MRNPGTFCAVVVGALALAGILSGHRVMGMDPDCPVEQPGGCPDLCAYPPAPVPPRPSWYFQTEALVLRRDVHGCTDVATLGNPTDTVFSTDHLDEPFKAGARFLIGHTFGETPFQMEFSYMALSPVDSSADIRNASTNALNGQGNLFSPFTDFGDPAVVSVDYNRRVSIREYSLLDGGELNLVRQLSMPPGLLTTAVLVGARCVRIREQFDYFSQQAADPAPLGHTSWLTTNTENELWGPQIGAIARFYVDGWWIDLSVKGAVFNNAASQQTLYVNADREGVVRRYDLDRSSDVTAYLGDLDLSFAYHWTPALTTRIGYQVMWVDGLALASENFHPSHEILTLGPGQIVDTGRAIYHGIHAGVELSW